jgi:hypothetical protein
MGKLNIKNGTPIGNDHLCRSCVHGQFTTGYRENDVMVVCTNSSPARNVPFTVHECTEFWDRNRPDFEQMEKLALSFSEGHRKPTPGFRTAGFNRVAVVVEADEDDEAATLR